jgi:hypothetical protein
MAALREAMEEAIQAPRSLLVSQDGAAFELVLDGERVVRLYADGRKNRGSTGMERRTKWDTETWAIVPAPAKEAGAAAETGASEAALRLAITTRLEGGPFDKPVVIRKLYERAPAP